MSEETTACEHICQDIDRMETVVGNVGLSIKEYREVLSYISSLSSHIEVMIQLDEEDNDVNKID